MKIMHIYTFFVQNIRHFGFYIQIKKNYFNNNKVQFYKIILIFKLQIYLYFLPTVLINIINVMITLKKSKAQRKNSKMTYILKWRVYSFLLCQLVKLIFAIQLKFCLFPCSSEASFDELKYNASREVRIHDIYKLDWTASPLISN